MGRKEGRRRAELECAGSREGRAAHIGVGDGGLTLKHFLHLQNGDIGNVSEAR